MGSNFKVNIDFIAHNYVSKNLGKISKDTRKLARDLAKTDKRSQSMMHSVKKQSLSYAKLTGSIVTAKVLSRGMAYIEQGIDSTIDSFIQLDQALTNAGAKFGSTASRGTKAFKAMNDLADELGGKTEFKSVEVAQGLDFAAKAGFRYKEAMDIMPDMLNLATVAQLDLARSSDIATDAMDGFGLPRGDDIEKSMRRISDVFAYTTTNANVDMENMFDTMKRSGSIVTAAGGDMETWAALTAKLGSAGIKGSIGATVIKNAYERLSATTPKIRAGLELLSVNPLNAGGDMRDMLDILQDISDKFNSGELDLRTVRADGTLETMKAIIKEGGKLGSGEKLKALKDIFGARAAGGIAAVLQKGVPAMREFRDAARLASGYAQKTADSQREGLGVLKDIVNSAADAKGREFIAGLLGTRDPANAMKDLAKYIREIDVKPWVNGVRVLAQTVKFIFDTLKDNRSLIYAFGAMWAIGKAMSMAKSVGSMAKDMLSMVDSAAKFALTRGSIPTLAGNVAGGAASSVAGGATSSLLGASVGTLLAGGIAGIATIVAGVVVAASVGVAVGSLVSMLWDKWKAPDQDNQLKRENKIATLTKTDWRTTDLKSRFYRLKELKRLNGDMNLKDSTMPYEEFKTLRADTRRQIAEIERFVKTGDEGRKKTKNGLGTGASGMVNLSIPDVYKKEVRVTVNVTNGPDGVEATSTVDEQAPLIHPQSLVGMGLKWVSEF